MHALLLLVLGCVEAPPPPPPAPVAPPPPSYDDVLAGLAADREALATRWAAGDATALPAARSRVLAALRDDLFPAWAGTPWAFYGTTEVPGEGAIACGYFVSTTLRDAGFRVERVRLAQQASEHILQSLVPEATLRRVRGASTGAFVDALDADGLYLVGLDFHVAYLLKEGESVQMCHSSYLPPGGVLCEDARTADALASRYRVVGQLLGDGMMERWLVGAPFATVGPMRR